MLAAKVPLAKILLSASGVRPVYRAMTLRVPFRPSLSITLFSQDVVAGAAVRALVAKAV